MHSQAQEPAGALPDLTKYAAVLFDLDGVLTPTAEVHQRAWQALFTPFLAEYAPDEPYREQDYYDHIDGKQRYDGVAGLLASRGLELPWGRPTDPPEALSVCGLGNRKDAVFRRVLQEEGVRPYPGSLELLEKLRRAGTKTAVVSSSRNAPVVLAAAGLGHTFEVVVDGAYAASEGLPSKPDPATYLRAAQLLGVAAAEAVVVEDALSGVEAGRRGGFGLVVGVDRGAGADDLARLGADLVVSDLAELAPAASAPPLDRRHYPVDEWRLIERVSSAAQRSAHAETLFGLGNGYLGLRGNDEEGGPAYEHGTFINGFHETWPIHYPEKAYGFAEVGQTILNLPDAKTIELAVDGEPLDLQRAEPSEYERVLDLAAGTLTRRLVWRTSTGARVQVVSRRMVSFEHRHLAVMTYEVTPLDRDVRLTLRSLLVDRQTGAASPGSTDAPPEAGFDPRKSEDMSGALQLLSHGTVHGGAGTFLTAGTRRSGLGLAVMTTHGLKGSAASPHSVTGHGRTETTYELTARAGQPATLHKLVAYHDGAAAELDGLLAAATCTLQAADALGVEALFAGQRRWLENFWADADVTVPGQDEVQQALRWNLFQIAQAAARADGRGVSAKGVTGSGYSGHYFWDTEIYVLPYLMHTYPPAARNALLLRHAMLPAARRRAQVMSEAGALFPWRTINGEEASAYYPAGTAQYHINADVTYAVAKYVAATGDRDFLARHGAEMAVETARLWLSLGFHNPATGKFHINAVTGPDEYSAVVDDNFYTNVMTAFNLRFAAETLAELRSTRPEELKRLQSSLNLGPHEPAEWLRAAEAMALHRDERLGIYLQDARWLDREPWDLAATPPQKRPLLLHYHPLVIYRHQVLKQADLVLALYLHAGRFTAEEKRAAFDYYDPLTTGDSSLSAAVQSIMAAEVGYPDVAMRHFGAMLYTDLADLHGNTADGVHVASAGGTWQALVGGFGGMRDDGGVLRLDPRLPQAWSSLGFVVRTNGAKVRVTVTHDSVALRLESGDRAAAYVRGRPVQLHPGEPVTVPL